MAMTMTGEVHLPASREAGHASKKVAKPLGGQCGERPNFSESVDVALNRKSCSVHAAMDRGHINGRLGGGIRCVGSGGDRRREQHHDPGGIHAGVASADLGGLGHGWSPCLASVCQTVARVAAGDL
jgi:hypothetical protein